MSWTSGTSRTTGISSESITDGLNHLGDAIDNSTNLDRWADAELVFTASGSPTARTVFELYLLYAIDGTNYEDGNDAATPIDPVKISVGVFAARDVSGQQRVTIQHIPLAPFKFKCLLKSELDEAATGVTLKLYTYNEA